VKISTSNIPPFFDVFGYGTFTANSEQDNSADKSKDKPDTFPLPKDPVQAFTESYINANDPVQLVTGRGDAVPIYIEVGSDEITNALSYNGTKNMCIALAGERSPGEAALFTGAGTPDAWVLNIGYILGWFSNVANGWNPPIISCDVFG